MPVPADKDVFPGRVENLPSHTLLPAAELIQGLTADVLPTLLWLCYNLRAVERTMHTDANRGSIHADSAEQQNAAEHPISFCPVCSERLEPKRCKLVCDKCGYYLSCSDYY